MSFTRKLVTLVAATSLAVVGVFAAGSGASASTVPPKPGLPHVKAHANLHPNAIVAWDTYAEPYSANGTGWTASLNNVGAHVEAHEPTAYPAPSGYSITDTLWVAWAAPATGDITISTYGASGTAEDTGIGIFTGSTMAKAKRLAIADDSSAAHFQAQIASFPIKKGTTYHFQIGTTTGSVPGNITVSLTGHYNAPGNDDLAHATTETGRTWVGKGSDVGATIESWEPTDNPTDPSSPRGDSVWWKWVPTRSGTIDVSTNGSASGDLYLGVFQGLTYDTPRQLDFDSSGAEFLEAEAINNLPVAAGRVVYFQVGSLFGFQDAIRLNFTATYTGPQITKVSPSSGSHKGGTKVTVKGIDLSAVDEVFIGTMAAPATVVSSTKLTFIAPASTVKGKVAIFLATGDTTESATNSHSHFTYK